MGRLVFWGVGWILFWEGSQVSSFCGVCLEPYGSSARMMRLQPDEKCVMIVQRYKAFMASSSSRPLKLTHRAWGIWTPLSSSSKLLVVTFHYHFCSATVGRHTLWPLVAKEDEIPVFLRGFGNVSQNFVSPTPECSEIMQVISIVWKLNAVPRARCWWR